MPRAAPVRAYSAPRRRLATHPKRVGLASCRDNPAATTSTAVPTPTTSGETTPRETPTQGEPTLPTETPFTLTRFYGQVVLDSTRVGRDAARIAEEVIQHLAGLVGAHVHVTLEIEAEIPDGVPDAVIRTVTENCRVLKFETQEFEEE